MTAPAKSAALVAGLIVVAGTWAPVAAARPDCQDSGTSKTCRTSGSTAIKAKPGTVAPPANQPSIPWLGQPGGRRR